MRRWRRSVSTARGGNPSKFDCRDRRGGWFRATVAIALAGVASAALYAAEGERISLWGGPAPVGNGQFAAEDAWLTVHRAAQPNGAAVVICPGGSYRSLVVGPEGHGIAEWLNRYGVAGLVLEYRLPAGRAEVPLLDAQRAIRMARARAADWGLHPSRIGVIGFSAGGHLASTAATHFDAGDQAAADPVARQSSRPDFAILIYPVIVMNGDAHAESRRNLLGPAPARELLERFSNERQVTNQTPPTFLAHALDDQVVPPQNSQAFHAALLSHGVPGRYLELPSGGHGLNGYQGPQWDAWQQGSIIWLRERQFLPVQ